MQSYLHSKSKATAVPAIYSPPVHLYQQGENRSLKQNIMIYQSNQPMPTPVMGPSLSGHRVLHCHKGQ